MTRVEPMGRDDVRAFIHWAVISFPINSRIRVTGYCDDCIILQFDRGLNDSATEVPVIFQSGHISLLATSVGNTC